MRELMTKNLMQKHYSRQGSYQQLKKYSRTMAVHMIQRTTVSLEPRQWSHFPRGGHFDE